MGPNSHKVAAIYDVVAKAYAAKFCGEHDKKPQDRDILYRFGQAVAGRQPIWDFGCGPGQTTQYLKNLGIAISGLDVSPKLIEQAQVLHPGIPFRRGNLLDLEFESIEIIERDPYPDVEYQSRRAYAFAKKPIVSGSSPLACAVTENHCGSKK